MPSNKSPLAMALLAGASLVSAHGYVSEWNIGGKSFKGFNEQYAAASGQKTGNEFIAWSDTAQDNGFVSPDAYSSPDIICHRGATNGALNNATAAAGETIKVTWNTWPDSHHGPVIDYLAAAEDPTTVDKTTLQFVKIQEKGLVSGSNPGKWASDEILANSLTWEIPIPADIKPGNYVLRHEIIALHSAGQANGAQNYPQCVNLKITGSGTTLPAGTAGEKLYTADEPGLKFNIYESFDSYPIPGPKLGFSASGSSSGSSAAAPAAANAAAPTSAAASSAAATTSASSAATSSAAAKSSSCKRRHARDVRA